MNRLALLIAALSISAAAYVAYTAEAWPHEAPTGWSYPFACCWGPSQGRRGDCAEIPASSVVEGPSGFEVTLAPGDHPMVKQPLQFVFPYGKERLAPDGRYHVCFSPDMAPRCFFSGAHGS